LSINELQQPRTLPQPHAVTLGAHTPMRPSVDELGAPAQLGPQRGWARPPNSALSAATLPGHTTPCSTSGASSTRSTALGRVLRLLQRHLQPRCAAPHGAPAACGPNPAPTPSPRHATRATQRRVPTERFDAPIATRLSWREFSPRPHQARHPGARSDAPGASD